MHKTAQYFALYTQSEMEEFNYIHSFGCTKEGVLSTPFEQYCAEAECGSLQQSSLGKIFDLSRLDSQIESYVYIKQRF